MKTFYLVILALSLMLCQTGVAQKRSKAEKAAQIEKGLQEVQKLVDSQQFQIDIDRVYPQNGMDMSRFNPTGKITIMDSIAKGELPFFGRAYTAPLAGDNGIEFDDLIKESSSKVVKKRKITAVEYKFSVPRKNDIYEFTISIASNSKCTVTLNSNNKSHISYSGTISPIEKEK